MRTVNGLTTLVVLVLIAPATALAGRFHAYSCRTPAGEVAPVDGWSGATSGLYSYAENTCSTGGSLKAALREDPGRIANTTSASWSFTTPTSDRLVGATFWRAGDADGGAAVNATYQFLIAAPTETEIFDECLASLGCTAQGVVSSAFAPANRVIDPNEATGAHLYLSASCSGLSPYKCKEGEHDPNGNTAVIYLYAADLILEQSAGPTANNVGGELATAPAVSGTSDVTFTATDPGAGVYEAVITVDGQVVQTTPLDENGGRCRNVGETQDGLPAFLYLQPCLQSVSADVSFDTTHLTNGSHHLLVSVTDAAGNAAPVLDRTVTVANAQSSGGGSSGGNSQGSGNGSQQGGGGSSPQGGNATGGAASIGSANGVNASTQATLAVSWKGARGAQMTSPFGRPQTVLGRLTGPGGVPIAGAQVELQATPAYAGARAAAATDARTGPSGRFTVRIPGGVSSRTLTFSYRTHLGDVTPAATATLSLNVSAGITLQISPRTTSVGRSIAFSGRLLGAPVPRLGKQLVLEARSPHGRWIEFNVVRAGQGGRFHASYRFKFPGPARYQFRVVSERESDYPFTTGFSNTVVVRER